MRDNIKELICNNQRKLADQSERSFEEHFAEAIDELGENIAGSGIAVDDVDGLTIIKATSRNPEKSYELLGDSLEKAAPNGTPAACRKVGTSANETWWRMRPIRCRTFEDCEKVLRFGLTSAASGMCLIRAGVGLHVKHRGFAHARRWADIAREPGEVRGALADYPRHTLAIDIDKVPLAPGLNWTFPFDIVDWVISRKLPEPFRDASYTWQFSSSGGIPDEHGELPSTVSIHLLGYTEEPIGCRDLRQCFAYVNKSKRPDDARIDEAVGEGHQPIFFGRPVFTYEGNVVDAIDPLGGARTGIYRGKREAVDLGEIAAKVRAEGIVESERGRDRQASGRAVERGPAGILNVRDYLGAWLRICREQTGYSAGRRGYRDPIWNMLITAKTSGETDWGTAKDTLREMIWAAARDNGDDATKAADLHKYLSDKVLDDAIARIRAGKGCK